MRQRLGKIGWAVWLAAVWLAVAPVGAAGVEGEGLAELASRNTPWVKGERVVFLGDSITASGGEKGGFVWSISAALKKGRAELGIEVIGAGVGGHRVSDLQARLQRDVLSRKPSMVFVAAGVNDVGAGVSAKAYEAGLRDILGELQAAGVTVVLGTPIVCGEKTDNSNASDRDMDALAGVCRGLCEETGATLCDWRAGFRAYLREHNKQNSDKGILTTDGVHLNAEGNRVATEGACKAIVAALRLRALREWIGAGHGLATWTGSRAPLKDNEKIIFFGDSITSSATAGNGYITLMDKALRKSHPELHVLLVNSGNSGNKVPNLQARLHADVLSKKPTVLFIYIGINDVWHDTAWDGSGTPPYAFKAGLQHIIEKARVRGATVVLATPSVIGEKTDGTNELDKRLDEYASISRGLAKEMGVTVCDLRKAFMDYLKRFNVENKERGVLTVDRVHLNDMGNLLVAHQAAEAISEALTRREQEPRPR